MLDETNCDAVMIGIGVLGNPWLIKNTINYLEDKDYNKNISIEEKINMILKHLEYLNDIKDEKIACLGN